MSEAAIRLKMSHISKSFGGVEALRGVDFTLRRGEIHALVGENGASIIILDEPTSALSPPEIERLFRSLRKLRDAGNSIIFISHFLEDVLTIADQITIFRNGRKVVTHAVSPEIDKAWIIQRMIGKGHEELESSYLGDVALASPKDAKTVLEAQGLSKAGSFEDVSLTVRSGEILGIYGFMGCGQIELAR